MFDNTYNAAILIGRYFSALRAYLFATPARRIIIGLAPCAVAAAVKGC